MDAFTTHCCAAPCLRAPALTLGLLLGLLGAASAQTIKPAAPACKAPTGWALSPPDKAWHRYQVQGRASVFSYSAQAQMRWDSLPDQGYLLHYEVKSSWGPERSQTSEGQWLSSGLRPSRFTDRGKRTLVTQTNAQRQTVRLPLAATEQAWIEDSQDKLSVLVDLGWKLACATTPWGKDSQLSLPVWGSGDIERWTWRANGWVPLATPYGERQAMQLTRVAQPGMDARIDLWFVPEWGALPARIRVEQDNGDRADLQLVERLTVP